MEKREYTVEQQEEIEALKSIFESEFSELSSYPPSFMIKLSDLSAELPSTLQLRFTLPDTYPDDLPMVDLPMRSQLLPKSTVLELKEHLKRVAFENQGMVMVFIIIDAARTWLEENGETIKALLSEEHKTDPVTEQVENVSLYDHDELSKMKLIKDKALRMESQKASGRWDYVIGLVGKPSAGKSTFFNAAVQQNIAKVAQHPFTTIEPNIGKAFVPVPCPCGDLHDVFDGKNCDAEYGHTSSGMRYVPVVLKDVAGLVPGAYNGRGMGNMFLNDLLDADVLIHIIDISGETDENGKQTTGYDPCQDVEWIKSEIQHWMYDNVMRKWDSISKRPSKLYDMFTGYHTSPSVIQLAFRNAGVDDKILSQLPTWSEQKRNTVVQEIVKEFLQVRFPIVHALNKCDKAASLENIKEFRKRFDGVIAVPLSALSECILQQGQKNSDLFYNCGDTRFEFESNMELHDKQKYQEIKSILDSFGSTGVLDVLEKAMGLRPPVLAYPVTSLDSCVTCNAQDNTRRLQDCILLKEGTSVNHLYELMCYSPLYSLSGDYVRAECRDNKGGKKVLHKEDLVKDIPSGIIKIMSTKKSSSKAR